MTTDTQPTDAVLVETRIAASPTRVWNALTDEIGEWWPNEFYTGGQPGKRAYTLDARPGGSMRETWEDGGGLEWARVITVMPEAMLQITGFAFPQWGGPSILFGTWNLEADGDGCKLRFTEHTLGVTPDGYAADKQKGWDFLFDGALKAYVEGTEPPKWED